MKILVLSTTQPFSGFHRNFGEILSSIQKSSMTFLCVSPGNVASPDEERLMAEVRANVTAPVLKVFLRVGNPIECLMDEIQCNSYDLVIIGAEVTKMIMQTMPAQKFSRIAREVNVPTMIIRQDTTRLERILICTGGLDYSDRVIEIGATLASEVNAEATLLYVASSVPTMYTGLGEMEETIQNIMRTDTPLSHHLRHGTEVLNQKGVRGKLEVRQGIVADEILRETQKGKYDLIVIGSSGSDNLLKNLMLGDVTKEVVSQSENPVLIVN